MSPVQFAQYSVLESRGHESITQIPGSKSVPNAVRRSEVLGNSTKVNPLNEYLEDLGIALCKCDLVGVTFRERTVTCDVKEL